MSHPQRALSLVGTLWLVVFFAVLSFALISQSGSLYQVSERSYQAAVARQMALAGLEDARVKLNLDAGFPPPSGSEQPVYSFAEVVYDLDQVTPVGSYQVVINATYAPDPQQILLVQSAGFCGPPAQGTARARSLFTAELDVAPVLRGATTPNPDFWTFIQVSEEL